MTRSICKHDQFYRKLITSDFELYECAGCSLIFSASLFSNKYRPNNVYKDYYGKNRSNRFNRFAEAIVIIFRLFRALEIKLLNTKARSVLDVGCGRGFSLYFLKKYFGLSVADGTQIENNAYLFATSKLGLNIYNQDLTQLDLPPDRYHIITYWHVLEHLPNPEEHIMETYKLIKKGGLLLIEVPNYDAWSCKLTRRYWLSYDILHHYYFFTHTSLEKLLERYNYKPIYFRSFSLEYSAYTSTQSIINLLTSSDNLLYLWLQKKAKFSFGILMHLLLFSIIFPVTLLINLLLYKSKRGEVLHYVFKKVC